MAFKHIPHPHVAARKVQGVAKVTDEHVGFNGTVASKITKGVGTMWCAYIFALIALISLPAAIASGSVIVIVAWVAQTFFQLVLLSVIMVGQDVQAKASDKRAEQTYLDAEAVLHECQQLQAHLEAQDKTLSDLITRTNPVKYG